MRPERLTTVPSPDAAFDKAIEVAAREVDKVQPLLDRASVRSALRAALAIDETSCVPGCWICVQPYDTAIADATAARMWLDKVSGAANALDLALGRGRPGHHP